MFECMLIGHGLMRDPSCAWLKQVADIALLFEEPQEVDCLLSHFLEALPLNAGGVYDARLRKRLNDMRY